MRRILQKFTVALSALALTTSVFAQDYSAPQYAKYGENPDDRKDNIMRYNTFTEAFKAKDYDRATAVLKELIVRAPKASQNLYAMGTSIYKKKISAAQGTEQMAVYIDSLMLLHDIRIEHFGGDAKRGVGYIMAEKIKDHMRYKKDDIEDLMALSDAAITAAGPKLDIEVLPAYYNVLVAEYSNDELSPDALIEEYDFLSTTLAGFPQTEERDEAVTAIEQLFIQSGVASCENLEKIYKPKFEANPNDADLIKKIGNYLAREECKSDFQNTIAEKSYEIEPNAAAAVMLAMAFEERGEADKAKEYMDQAISLETDAKTKSNYCVRAAGVSLSRGDARVAADYARAAIEADAESGTAYMLLAQAYAVGASSACSAFNRSAAYWLVVDTLVKARSLSAGDDAQVESINGLIRTYTAYFPKTEDMFFSDPPVQDGSAYTVRCGWISGSTTARGR